MNRSKVQEYRDRAKAVSDAITAWGQLSSCSLEITPDMWCKFYNPAVGVGMWKVRDIVNDCTKYLDAALIEDARPKFDRKAALRDRVLPSVDYPGMYCVYIKSHVCWYATQDDALDALEAIFNAKEGK